MVTREINLPQEFLPFPYPQPTSVQQNSFEVNEASATYMYLDKICLHLKLGLSNVFLKV